MLRVNKRKRRRSLRLKEKKKRATYSPIDVLVDDALVCLFGWIGRYAPLTLFVCKRWRDIWYAYFRHKEIYTLFRSPTLATYPAPIGRDDEPAWTNEMFEWVDNTKFCRETDVWHAVCAYDIPEQMHRLQVADTPSMKYDTKGEYIYDSQIDQNFFKTEYIPCSVLPVKEVPDLKKLRRYFVQRVTRPVQIAAYHGAINVLKSLDKTEVQERLYDVYYCGLMVGAIIGGQDKVVAKLVLGNPKRPHPFRFMQTILFYKMAFWGRWKMLLVCIDKIPHDDVRFKQNIRSFAILGGQTHVFKSVMSDALMGSATRLRQYLELALAYGRLPIVRYLVKMGAFTSNFYRFAVHSENIEMLEYVREHHGPCENSDHFKTAVRSQNKKMVRWFRQHCEDAVCTFPGFTDAWNGAYFPCYQTKYRLFVIDHLYIPDPIDFVLKEVIPNNQLDILKHLKETRNIPMTYEMANKAASRNRFKILKYVVTNGAAITQQTLASAFHADNIRMIRWLRERGCPCDPMMCLSAFLERYHTSKKVTPLLMDMLKETYGQ